MLDGSQKRFLLLALTMIGVSLVAGAVSFTRSSPAHAQSSCTNYYTPSIAVVGGYAAAYDLFGTSQLLVQASCAKPTPTLDVGRGSTLDYIYKLGYIYQNNAWAPLTLTSSSALVSSSWYPASASGPRPSQSTTGATTGGTTGGTTAGDTNCALGDHGLVRGRAHVAHGTLVADDGCIIRAASLYIKNYDPTTDPSWWRAAHDIGHFNGVRAMAYIDNWMGGCCFMDLQTLENRLDATITNAKQTGMYVIIDNHSAGGRSVPTDWNLNTQFWTAIAARYANDTNVVYEIINEPEVSPGQENSAFQLIRSLAPQTPVIAWSFESITKVDDQAGLLNVLAQGNQIDYSNAAVGYHPYEAVGQEGRLASLASQMQHAGYPVVMTEYSNDHTPPLSYLYSLNTAGINGAGISWFFLDGTGWIDAVTGLAYEGNNDPITITWPKD